MLAVFEGKQAHPFEPAAFGENCRPNIVLLTWEQEHHQRYRTTPRVDPPSAHLADSASAIVEGIPRPHNCFQESTHGTEGSIELEWPLQNDWSRAGFHSSCFWRWLAFFCTAQVCERKDSKPISIPNQRNISTSGWRNQCMKALWLCKLRPDDKTPELFGMDCYALFESKRLLLDFLQKHDPEFHKEVAGRLAFIDKFTDAHAYVTLWQWEPRSYCTPCSRYVDKYPITLAMEFW